MSEEDLLSRWLHEQTPQPPRTLTAADITPARLRRVTQHKAIRWAPILAAAVVVLVAVLLAVVAGSAKHHRTPPAHTSPRPSPSPSSKVGPWGATPIPGNTQNMLMLAEADGSLYVENAGPIQRIDPITGRVLASNPGDTWDVNAVAVAEHLLWVVTQQDSPDSRSFDVTAFDLKTLTEVAAVPVTFSHSGGGADALLTASADGTRLAVAYYGDIAVIDPAQRRIVHQLKINQDIHALALNPDGSGLYLGEQTPQPPRAAQLDTGSVLHVADPLTGTELAAPIPVRHIFSSLEATRGGVWVGVTTIGATHASLYWLPTGAAALGTPVAAGAHDVSATLLDGVVLITGGGKLSCADPTTGSVRASVTAFLDIYGLVDGQWYGTYSADVAGRVSVVRVTPPAACTR